MPGVGKVVTIMADTKKGQPAGRYFLAPEYDVG
jgi:hypothetical protein